MKTNFKITILSVLIGISTITYAQQLPQVVPPSPEASALFKFNEVPVSLHNGTHNTSIPLLDLSDSGVSLPITLSYHSQGVLLSDLASRVGTGWTLNYGGMISRQIRGNADENNGFEGYLSTNNSTPDYYLDYNTRLEDYSYQSSSTGVNYDYYPDKFMINSNFHSGEFYLDRNNDTIITQKFSDVKINKYLGAYGIMSFDATDNQGNKYYYGDNDTNLRFKEREEVVNSFIVPSTGSVSYGTNSNGFSISSWNLKKIVTATNELVEFKYDNEVVRTVRRTGDIDNQYSGNYQQGDPLYTCNFTVANSYQNVLKEIIYKHGKVKFISSLDGREDLFGGHALDRIEQYNTKNELVKLIRFNYFYTTGSNDTDNVNNYLLSNDSRATKRLFLESVVFVDLLTNEEQKYSFEYDSQVLPNRHSNAVDAYGYYNGKNRGKYLIFEDIIGNASVNPVKQQAGLLKKIVYPTGGHTVFKYEPNIVKNNLPNNIKIQNPNPLVHGSEILSFIEPATYSYATTKYEKQITIPQNIVGQCTVNLVVNGSYGYLCYLTGNGQFYSFNALANNTLSILPGDYTLVFDPQVTQWDQYPTLNPDGTVDTEATMERYFSISIQWNRAEYDYNSIIYGPGCRIKKITHFSDENKEEFSREYEYVGDDNGISGYLISISNYLVKHEAYPANSNVYHNSPNLPGGRFSSYVKDNLSYFKVNEYFKDNSNNINDKTSYYYSLTADFGSYSFPNHLFTDNEWLRGKEMKKILFKKYNNAFIPVRKIENSYLLFGSELIDNTPMFNLISSPVCIETVLSLTQNFNSFPYIRNKTQFCYPTSTGCPIYTFSGVSLGYRTSFFTGGTLDLHETKVTEYFDSGEEMETITTYGYDYNNHYNVANVSTTNSFGETSETKYQYASNTSNQALKDKNMVAIPLITETYKNGEKLSTIKTDYKDWNPDANITLLAPEFIKASKGTATLETRIIYNKVDSANGNPIEVQQEGGIHICYIWGYNKTQPIAKIENATYTQVQAYEANLQNISNTGTEANLISALNSLRTALPNALITTYTYKPLVGISTVTDPKGDKQTYHYDGFGRLQFVKDAQDNIISESKYHYRTQN